MPLWPVALLSSVFPEILKGLFNLPLPQGKNKNKALKQMMSFYPQTSQILDSKMSDQKKKEKLSTINSLSPMNQKKEKRGSQKTWPLLADAPTSKKRGQVLMTLVFFSRLSLPPPRSRR